MKHELIVVSASRDADVLSRETQRVRLVCRCGHEVIMRVVAGEGQRNHAAFYADILALVHETDLESIRRVSDGDGSADRASGGDVVPLSLPDGAGVDTPLPRTGDDSGRDQSLPAG